jgi:hypothetical protein
MNGNLIYWYVADGLKTLTAPAVAAFAAWIAHRQWTTASQKLKLDLFDRRYRVYVAALAFFGRILERYEVTLEDIVTFQRETAQAKFLFPDAVVDHLAEDTESGHRPSGEHAAPRQGHQHRRSNRRRQTQCAGTGTDEMGHGR